MITITMREVCKRCGCEKGVVCPVNGQNVVRCFECNQWAGYNAPRAELGQSTESISSDRSTLKPKRRARLIRRANGRCEACGAGRSENAVLHVGHVLSVNDAKKYDIPQDVYDSDENLIVQCGECNLGQGSATIPIRLLIGIIVARHDSKKES